MVITAVERTKKGGRYNLYVEGEFALSVDGETAALHRLSAGREITPEDLTQLRDEDCRRGAKEKALALLSARSYTKRGLAEKLEERAGREIAWETAERMEELGLVDDEDYARRYARERMKLKGYGPARVRRELLQKGIDRELADEVLEEIQAGFDAQGAIEAIVRRKYWRFLGERRGVEKTVAALARLGYAYGDIRAVLSRLMREELPPEEF